MGKGLQPKSRDLQPLSQRLLIIIATNPLVLHIRKRRGLVSYQAINSMDNGCQNIIRHSALVCFTRSQECLRESTCHIASKKSLVSNPDNSPSRKDWEDP